MEPNTKRIVGTEDQDDKDAMPDVEGMNEAMANLLDQIATLRSKVEEKGVRPPQEAKVFYTNKMNGKVDDIYQEFTEFKRKLHLDFSHKPYFVDFNPETELITLDGEPLMDATEDDLRKMRDQMEDDFRNVMYETLHNETYSRVALFVYITIVTSIVVSVVQTIISTIPSLENEETIWFHIEAVVTTCFVLEYITKLLFVRNPVKYALRVMNVLDLLAILPFFISLGVSGGGLESAGGVLRALRLTRIAKIRQLASPYTNIIMQSTVDSITGAGSSAAIFMFIGTVMTGTLVFAFERDENSEKFQNIPMAMWYSLVTMTTVGYGDLYPITPMGQILGTFTILCGIVLMSLIIMVVGQYYIINMEKYEGDKSQIKEELFKASGENLKTYRKWLKKDKAVVLFERVKLGLRIRAEKKKKWSWSLLKGPNEVEEQYTYRSTTNMDDDFLNEE